MVAFSGCEQRLWLFERFRAEQMIALMNDSLAARLEKSKVMEVFHGLLEKYSVEQIVIIMSASLMQGWRNRSSWQLSMACSRDSVLSR